MEVVNWLIEIVLCVVRSVRQYAGKGETDRDTIL